MPNFPSPGIAWSSHISFWSRGNKPRNMSWSIPFLSIFLCLLLFHFNFFRLVWFWIYLKDSSHSFFHLISPCLRFLPADPFFSVGRNNLEQVHRIQLSSLWSWGHGSRHQFEPRRVEIYDISQFIMYIACHPLKSNWRSSIGFFFFFFFGEGPSENHPE